MKTFTLSSFLIKIALILMVAHVSAQDLTSTRIDVQGARFSDQLWLFTVPTCTYNFDNGWDGYKMIGTSSAPQLFAIEPDGTYQVDAVPNVNNRYLGFSAGIDTVYTFTFVHENLSVYYTQLYLIDSVAKKTIDIVASGTTYTFSAKQTTEPIRRFKIVTSLPPVVITPVPKDTVPVVTPPTVPPIPIDPKDSTNKDCKDKKDKNWFLKKIKIYASDKYIYIENPFKLKGKLKVCHALTGKILNLSDFNADGTTIINPNIPRGIYIVTGTIQSDIVTAIVIIK